MGLKEATVELSLSSTSMLKVCLAIISAISSATLSYLYADTGWERVSMTCWEEVCCVSSHAWLYLLGGEFTRLWATSGANCTSDKRTLWAEQTEHRCHKSIQGLKKCRKWECHNCSFFKWIRGLTVVCIIHLNGNGIYDRDVKIWYTWYIIFMIPQILWVTIRHRIHPQTAGINKISDDNYDTCSESGKVITIDMQHLYIERERILRAQYSKIGYSYLCAVSTTFL